MDPDKGMPFLRSSRKTSWHQERKAGLPITHLTFGVSWEVEPPYGAFSMSIKSWEYLNRDVVFHYGRVHQLGVYNFPKCVHKGNVKARVEVERGFWNSLDERFALQCEEQSWNLKHSCKCQVGTEILLWCPFLKGGGGMTRSWTTTLAGGGATAGSLSRFASWTEGGKWLRTAPDVIQGFLTHPCTQMKLHKWNSHKKAYLPHVPACTQACK